MRIAKILLLVVLALFVFIAIAVIVAVRTHKESQPAVSYSSTRTIASVLIKTNPDFAAAEGYRAKNDYADALRSYQSALAMASDEPQRGEIGYDIALMEYMEGQYAQAITGFKQVAADEGAGLSLQAYAVQELGVMYYNSSGSDARTIASETFSGSPYAAFFQDGDISLAYRRLFEYACSFYALPYGEANIGQWYANDLIVVQRGATTTPQGAADVEAAKQSIEAASSSVPQVLTDPSIAKLDSAALGRAGQAAVLLASVGALQPVQAEQYFERGVAFDAAAGFRQGGFNAYRLAAFIAAHYGTSQASTTAALLAPFKQGNDANIALTIPAFFTSARTNAFLASDRASLILLGTTYPAFKSYLLSLGWQAGDFDAKHSD